jgi:ABC-2 type transport system ATP-binding protein
LRTAVDGAAAGRRAAIEPAGPPSGRDAGPPAIEVRGLRKRYGALTVLDGLDLAVPRGELVALLGPNGAGKTTTVEILEGYRGADGGEIRVLGMDPTRDRAALHGRVGLMLQSGGITPQGRPRELVRLHARFYADPANPDELLDLLGLTEAADRRYKLLSGGEKQRLSLALALVGRPELLILDEPTAGMDPAAKAVVRSLIADLRSAGRTILLTTHELADVERLADRVVVMDRGRVVAAGTPAELVAGSGPVLRFRLASGAGAGVAIVAEELESLGAALGGTLVPDGAPGRHRLAGSAPDPRAIAYLADWCEERGLLLAELQTSGGTLEERFLELIAESRPGDQAPAATPAPVGDASGGAAAEPAVDGRGRE